MRKLKSLAFVAIFAGSMLYSPKAEAKHHSGNYINDDGCLVVWSYDSAFFGLIHYNTQEDIFCNSDGSSIELEGNTCCSQWP